MKIRVDEQHKYLLKKYVWRLDTHGYAITQIWKNNKRRHQKLHRLIFKLSGGKATDHINGDRLDNRLCNLREVTKEQNQWNSKISKNNKAGFKGVCLDKRRGKYKAEICCKGNRFFLGYFNSPEEASMMYGLAALKLFGKYARLQ